MADPLGPAFEKLRSRIRAIETEQGRFRRVPPLSDCPLSRSEAAVVACLAAGMQRAEIARKRGVSEWTVQDQIKSARVKLGARTIGHAVAIVVDAGWLPSRVSVGETPDV